MIIYWQIGDKSGHGEPNENKLAQIWVDFMNNIYGPNTHWCKNYTKDVERNLSSKCNAGRYDGAYPHGENCDNIIQWTTIAGMDFNLCETCYLKIMAEFGHEIYKPGGYGGEQIASREFQKMVEMVEMI
jgi:hypothetical protein